MGHWRTVVGDGDSDVDDEEVTFLGGRGWELRGQPPQPAGPPQPEEDVGHLISTLATRLQLGTPRINIFSSNAMPGKTEVSFKQWYHDIQCVKDQYPELGVWESIVRSLKVAVVDMAWYMGATNSIAHMLQRLTIIFSTMASFDVLMQNFTKLHKVTTRRSPPLPQG